MPHSHQASQPVSLIQPKSIDGGALADRRQIAGMFGSGMAAGGVAAEPRLDGRRDMVALLLGGRRHAGNGPPIRPQHKRGVADDENLRDCRAR